ncbi:MAG: GPW/gp25 family protein [Bacteroidota bacterium]
MQLEYYSLPMALERVMRQQEHPRCSLQQSVTQHLHLLLTTSFGEFPGDENFGCGIWEHDFDNVTSAHKLKELIRQSLLKSIQEQEKRLGNVRVELMILQEEMAEGLNARRVKKRINISVTGVLHSTNEPLVFRDGFFVGPLSY